MEARRALELNPNYTVAHLVLAEVFHARGMDEEAMGIAREAAEISRSWVWVQGRMAALTGREAEARQIVEELEAGAITPYIAFEIAVVHAALGELDEAFRWIDVERPHAWVPWFRVDRIWTHVQDDPSDPRFQAMLQRMNLPPVQTG